MFVLIVTKIHCNVIKSIGDEQNGSDDLLQESIKIWKHTNEKSTDLVTKATTTAVLYIAKHLLLNKAVLYLGHAKYLYRLIQAVVVRQTYAY